MYPTTNGNKNINALSIHRGSGRQHVTDSLASDHHFYQLPIGEPIHRQQPRGLSQCGMRQLTPVPSFSLVLWWFLRISKSTNGPTGPLRVCANPIGETRKSMSYGGFEAAKQHNYASSNILDMSFLCGVNFSTWKGGCFNNGRNHRS